MEATYIREATLADLIEISKIEVEVFSDPWSEIMLLSTLIEDECWVICRQASDVILAYLMRKLVLDEYSIYNLAVQRDYQNKGYGSSLLLAVLEKKKKEGCTRCLLEVRKNNLAALSFYTKLGFKKIYLREGYYCNPEDDAIVMLLQFNNNEG